VNQRVLSKRLRNAGCIVSVANHGGEALTFLATSQLLRGQQSNGIELSLVLMDLKMPIMDGLTCVKRIDNCRRRE
jgi:CheY-like chemotaxis protein